MPPRARRTTVAADLRPATGYASSFTLPVEGTRFSPEWWARAALDAPPRLLRWGLRYGWRFGLGLRLGSARAPERVQGWRIESADGHRAVLLALSRWVTARNIFTVERDTVSWTTVVEWRNAVGRVLWTSAAPLHELSVPWLLARASRRTR